MGNVIGAGDYFSGTMSWYTADIGLYEPNVAYATGLTFSAPVADGLSANIPGPGTAELYFVGAIYASETFSYAQINETSPDDPDPDELYAFYLNPDAGDIYLESDPDPLDHYSFSEVDAPTPEPSTSLFVGAGLALVAVGAFLRRLRCGQAHS